jgi:hypothetical protein
MYILLYDWLAQFYAMEYTELIDKTWSLRYITVICLRISETVLVQLSSKKRKVLGEDDKAVQRVYGYKII